MNNIYCLLNILAHIVVIMVEKLDFFQRRYNYKYILNCHFSENGEAKLKST